MFTALRTFRCQLLAVAAVILMTVTVMAPLAYAQSLTGRVATVSVKGAVIRNSPHKIAATVRSPQHGDRVFVLCESNGYYGVLLHDESVGWIPKWALTVGKEQVALSIPKWRSAVSATSPKSHPPAQAKAPKTTPRLTPRYSGGLYAGLGGGHWIKSISDEGDIITLEDGSVWQVSSYDTYNTTLWLPISDITVIESKDPIFPYKLINTDDSETALCKLLSR